MIVYVIAVGVMEVAIMKVIRVAVVLHSRVSTIGAVLMAMSTLVLVMSFRHSLLLYNAAFAAMFFRDQPH